MIGYKQKTEFARCSHELHPEHETRNTRVSEYLRKYGSGKIDEMPADRRPEVKDNRTVDEMLADVDKLTSSLATEQLDVLVAMQSKAADFEAALKDIKLTQKQKEQFDAAIATLKDNNASYTAKADAYRILDELEQANKVKRARV